MTNPDLQCKLFSGTVGTVDRWEDEWPGRYRYNQVFNDINIAQY